MNTEIQTLIDNLVDSIESLVHREVSKKLYDIYSTWRLQLMLAENKRMISSFSMRPSGVCIDAVSVLLLRKQLAQFESTVTHKNKGVSLVYSPGHAQLAVRIGISNRELQEAMLAKPVSRFALRQIGRYLTK